MQLALPAIDSQQIIKNETITSILGGGGTDTITATVLATSAFNANMIIFSTSTLLTLSEYNGRTTTTVIMSDARAEYTITGDSLYLKEINGCRMVAEFTIKSFD